MWMHLLVAVLPVLGLFAAVVLGGLLLVCTPLSGSPDRD